MTAGMPAISIGQSSSAGPKSRNDDSYGVLAAQGTALEHKGIAMAIADGMSSSERAKIASETCVRSFLDDYFATHESWTVKKSAALVLKSINSWLVAQNNALTADGADLVTTLTAAVLKSGTLHVFHVGDSRLSLFRDGTLEPLTTDHRAGTGRDANALTRALGVKPNVEIDYRAEPIEAGDVLVFTTDGVHETIPVTAMIKHLASGQSLDEIAAAITTHALANGSADNVTCQIVRIDDPGRRDSDSHYAALRSLPFPPDLEPGMVFEGYRIVREIHASKRTHVYQAIDAETGAMAVLKMPSINFEDDPTYLDMFTREDWIGRIVSSPNVLQVLPHKTNRRFLYYATEYFDGQTLRTWMKAHPRASLEAVRRIVEQIAVGLRAFHRRDVIHQDLKPENIMIDANGRVKIIDFGSSRAASLAEAVDQPEMPALVGTLDYTAPEYHLGAPATNRSDIYSLGVIAYEMLTGALPYTKGFAGPKDVTKLEYVSARTLRDDIPLWVDAALAQAVAKNAERRTGALSEFVEDLNRPRADFDYPRTKPWIERDPIRFWKAACLSLLLLNVLQLILHAHVR